MAEPQIDVMDEGGSQSLGAKYAVNPSTGQVMRNDGSGWSKVKSAKNAQGEILINEGGSWIPVPKGGQARDPMTRKDVVPLMAREGLEWGTSDESAGARRAAGLPKWADKAINATPMGTFANIGMGVGAIGAEAAGANMPDAYTQGRDEVRGNINQARDEYPVTSMVSEIAGGVAYPGGAMKGGAPLVKQVPRMGFLGATQGGFYGFNSAEGDLGGRADAGKTGAAMGAALGGALPVGVAGARVPARALKNTGASLYDGFMGLFGKDGGARMGAAEQTAIAAVRRSMERSQMTPQQIAAAVQEFGDKPAVLAEVIGQDAIDALTALTRKPGSTSQKGQAIIEERYGGFADRASDDLRQATGLTDDQIAGKFDKDLAARRKKANPLYKGAFDTFGTISSPRLKGLSETSDTLRKAMSRANKALSDEAAIAGKAPGEMSQLQYWDLVKRQLDDAYDAAAGKPGNNDEMRRIEMIRKEVLGQLDAYTGGKGGPYAAAREAGGEAPRMMEARTQGERVMRPSTKRQTVQDQVDALNPQDRMPYASGVAADLDEKIANNMTPQRIARVPANSEKITTALGEDAGGQFVSKMEAEAKLRDTGSRWGPRMSSVTGTVAERPSSELMEDGARIGFHVLRGNIREAIISAASMMRRRGYNQREIDAMGDLLLSNPMEGLKRLGVRLPSGGNGGAPANALANTGSAPQQTAPAGVNALAPVKSAGVSGLRSDAGAAAVGGAVGGFAPAESTEERLRNVGVGAGGLALARRGGAAYKKGLDSSVAQSVRNQPALPARGHRGPVTLDAYERAYQEAVAQTGIRKNNDPKNHAIAIELLTNAGFSREYADDVAVDAMRALDRASLKQGGGLRVVDNNQPPTSGMGFAGGGDAANALAGGAVGSAAPAESTEDRLRNIAVGAGIATTGGRLDRVLPKRGGSVPARAGSDLPFNEGQTFYHATNAPEFSQFKVNPKGHNRLGKGVYLTSSQDDARGFLKDGRVVETHIRGDVFDAKRGSDEMVQEVAQRTGIDPQKVAKTILRPDGRYSGSDKATELLKKAGFSGVTDTDGHFPSQVMVFDPADVQIKGQDGVSSAGFGDKPKTAQQAVKIRTPHAQVPLARDFQKSQPSQTPNAQSNLNKSHSDPHVKAEELAQSLRNGGFDVLSVRKSMNRDGGKSAYINVKGVSDELRVSDHSANMDYRPGQADWLGSTDKRAVQELQDMLSRGETRKAERAAAESIREAPYKKRFFAATSNQERGEIISEMMPGSSRDDRRSVRDRWLGEIPVSGMGFGGGKLPKLRKDVPTGTPKQAGPSRMSGSIQRGLEESSSMGAAKATGDKAVRQKTAMSEANRMAEAGRNYVDVFEKTGVVLIPYKGGTIKYYAPGADHPDTVIRTFISDLNKPLEKRQPMTNSILTAIGEQEEPLMLGRANTPMIEGTMPRPGSLSPRNLPRKR